MKLIIRGDDLGWSDGVNAGIEKVARDGILTSTGCMPNMKAAERGIKIIEKYGHINIGQHTNITIGKPISDPKKIPHLVDENGNFNTSKYYRDLQKKQSDVLPYYDEISIEVEAQLNRFIKIRGKKPDYLEGHAIPSITFEKVLEDIATKHSILYFNPRDKNNEYSLYCPPASDYTMDIFKNNNPIAQFEINVASYIIKELEKVLDKEYVMLVFHPGFVDAEIMKTSSFNGVRMCDTEALCSDKIKEWIKQHNIELIGHKDLRRR
ncbi:ChbG/HpnK family deacetylase [Breznakia pachnodae]|uniref:Glycoside hydrolase/deacetylase ChbG (UPF0249 family) n=1 Tax=Breznakia pachnodae TaxID=265178 RepID=A0ABU0E137_9FIRM|nr:ChbG/HpnK family deacetylase [Breznakia pachnodae]MDQ0360426.1 putative glycoside hydrolase/deacetylase ChbG (UPF0249 family) [Breznakia pachnodae]